MANKKQILFYREANLLVYMLGPSTVEVVFTTKC